MVDKNMSNPEDTNTPEIKCPHCGNTDTSKMVFVEDVQSVRSVLGFNENGTLVISSDSYTTDEGEDSRINCTGCQKEFPLPDDIQYGEG